MPLPLSRYQTEWPHKPASIAVCATAEMKRRPATSDWEFSTIVRCAPAGFLGFRRLNRVHHVIAYSTWPDEMIAPVPVENGEALPKFVSGIKRSVQISALSLLCPVQTKVNQTIYCDTSVCGRGRIFGPVQKPLAYCSPESPLQFPAPEVRTSTIAPTISTGSSSSNRTMP